MKEPTALVILDGFGYSPHKAYNAIAHAHIPHITAWMQHYPHAILQAAGEYVGLPPGYIGNSEVGHMTIGAGRIIEQPITKWFNAIKNGTFFTNPLITHQHEILRQTNGSLHILSLLSDAGIHAHEDLLYATIEANYNGQTKIHGNQSIILHLFLDGRDTPPQSAHHFLHKLQANIINRYPHVILGSIHGRFYAMDRDHNWDRTESSYRIITEKQRHITPSWEKILEYNYTRGITDEFIPPTQLTRDGIIKNGDGIFFCNIRPDRMRQLAASFIEAHFNHFIIKPVTIASIITAVEYDATFNVPVLWPRPIVTDTLKDQLAARNKTIYTIAETEKYAHVTYFFRAELEAPVATETRVMIPSLHPQTYAHYPEMSGKSITAHVLESVVTNPYDFYLINYANADMVGHSGNYDATIKAVEFLDTQLAQLFEAIVEQMNGTLYITADHGKAEEMFDTATDQPRTAHTANPVPFIMIRKGLQNKAQLPLTQLADIAPFILKNII